VASYKEIQNELANAIRHPERASPFEQRRLAVYQELFFNNVEGFCASAFPVLKSTLDEKLWLKIVRSFFQNHKSETPHFIEISEEFLSYLSEHPELLPWPWCLELAHYEWVELVSSVAKGQVSNFSNLQEVNVEELNFIVPESTWPLAYNFPVHTISADNCQNIEQEATFIIIYRDDNEDVKFSGADALTIHLLNFAQSQELVSYDELLLFLTGPNIGLSEEQSISFLETCLLELIKRNILFVNN